MLTREQELLIALNSVNGLGNIRIMKLLNHYSYPSRILEQKADVLARISNVSLDIAKRIPASINSADFKDELKRVRISGLNIVTIIDNTYPQYLKQIYDPPVVLYVLGDVYSLQRLAVAVVGCRRASYYGIRQAERIAADLSRRGIYVVSGLARGIDAAAHRGALSCGGRTIAVLGSGISRIYPAENKDLFERITKSGAVISEFPIASGPRKENFPRRNRIISGLCKAVVIVEAAKRSGSLITANLALEQGREVYAVPGTANSVNAQGTHKLIKEGAKLVESAEDILADLNISGHYQNQDNHKKVLNNEERIIDLDERAKKLLEFLTAEPVHIDLLVKYSRLDCSCVYRDLLELQLKGLVKEVEGKRFCKTI